MVFEDIRYLGFLFVIPWFIFFSIKSFRMSDKWLCLFAREKKKPGPYILSVFFICMTVAAVAISLAEPAIRYEKTCFNRKGIELAIGIDVSKSMLAEDAVFPVKERDRFSTFNRLNRARCFALDILSGMRGERLGVYAFAGKGVELVPFTRDYGYCRYILKHISETEITGPGSDLGEAIRTGAAMLKSFPCSQPGNQAPGISVKGAKVIILISDGEDIHPDKSSLYESARCAADNGIRIYTVGVGTGKGVLIPVRNEKGDLLSYYTDKDGLYLKTRLVQDSLENIATVTGGQYFRINRENTSENLIKAVLKEAMDVTKSREVAWLDLSPFFMITGLVFFVAGVMTAH